MKNHLSFSSVEKYLQCGRQWYLYYICGLREKYVGSALIFGNAIDEGLNCLLNAQFLDNNLSTDYHEVFNDKMCIQKLNGKEIELSSTNLINYGNEDFDFDILTEEDKTEIEDVAGFKDQQGHFEKLLELKKAKQLKGDKLRQFNKMSWISLKRKGHLFLDAYKEQVLPLIKRVIAIQHEITIKNENEDEFVFKIDLIAELKDDKLSPTTFLTQEQWNEIRGKVVIFDNKTSGSPYKDDSVLTSKQLASYIGAISEQNNLNLNLDNLYQGYIVVNKKIRKKKEPKVNIQIIIDKVPETMVDLVFNDYDTVNENIHNGVFLAKSDTCKGFFGKCFCSLKKDQIVDISVNWRKKK